MKRKNLQEKEGVDMPTKTKKKKNQNVNVNSKDLESNDIISNANTTKRKTKKELSRKLNTEDVTNTPDSLKIKKEKVGKNGMVEEIPELKQQPKKKSQKRKVIAAENNEECEKPKNKSKASSSKNNKLVDVSEIPTKKAKKKVRIDETESLKIKKEMADTELHFSVKELPAKIIKSKLNKALTEEVKVSPITVQHIKLESEVDIKSETDINSEIDIKSENETNLNDTKEADDGSSTTECSDLEVYYINKNAEKEARKKELILKKNYFIMSKEDQDMLVKRIQDCIPANDTRNYKYRLTQLEWDKIPFNNYTIEDCQKTWTQLLKKVRHYRLLSEITNDIKHSIQSVDLNPQSKPPKASAKRHPDMPKRPLSSYFLFYLRKKDKIAKDHPEADVIELNKFISEKYYNLPLEKKQKYDEFAAKNREKYKKDMEEFYAKHPEMRKNIPKEPKVKKEKPPKKPQTPYKLYVLSETDREEVEDQDKTEFKELCREKWKQMPDTKKLVWINLAEEHEQKYQEELKDFMARHPEYVPQPFTKPFLSREELNLKDKLAGKPKRPPGTAYSLFLSMVMQSEEMSDIPVKERMNYCSVKWKNMTESDKDYYRQRIIKVTERYQEDFNTYIASLPEDKRQAEILLNNTKKKRADTEKSSSHSKNSKETREKAATAKKAKSPTKKQKALVNPVPPPRSVYKYFAEKYEGENPKEAWKNLDSKEKHRYENELSSLKDAYIKDFEAYLKSLTKEELSTFCANRNQQNNSSSSEESDSDSEDSSDESSDSSDTDEN